jgi:hypothetical protein
MTTTDTTGQHAITYFGGKAKLTMPIPYDEKEANKMLPGWSEMQDRDVDAILVQTGANTAILTIGSLDVDEMEPWYATVVWIIESFWQELIAHGFVTGPMPKIVVDDKPILHVPMRA